MIMKPFLRSSRNTLLALGSLAVLFTSCDKDDDDTNMSGDRTITGAVVANDNFSTLEAAVIKANLQSTLSGTGPFTVFAPDNAAFEASGVTPAVLNGLTQEQVSSILLYHTVGASINAAAVPAGPNAKVMTASGDSVFVTRNASGVFINGIRVEEADIAASNGIIHRIGKVLMPPAGNLVAVAQIPSNGLDSLVKAVLRAANGPGGNPALLSTLQSGTFTLFAPTNAAFTQLLGTLGVNDINAIPVATLTGVLQYHLVPGRAFSSDLSNGSLTMLAGGSTTVNLTNGNNGGPTIMGSSDNMSRANIVSTNIMARNGVVHLIDRVLLP
jgi:uncharacterized surface protein with fasciclin (FAS1) repeats